MFFLNHISNIFLAPRENGRINWALTNNFEVKRVVNKLNNVKPGPDKIPISIFKKNIDVLSPILTHLCNLSLSRGRFPKIHKHGIIVPIYKSKDKYELENYRPICLLNACSKILEKIVSLRLMSHLEDNNLLSDHQFAYRRGRGTDLATAKFVQDVLKGFDQNKITIAVFLDLTKAFDSVNHAILEQKLKYYGIDGIALNWIKDYLRDRKQVTSFNNTLSNESTINIGVPQGSILGPILFLIFINDFCNLTNIGELLLFADDANHYVTGTNFFDVLNRVNNNLETVTQWFLANKLAINIIKSRGDGVI